MKTREVIFLILVIAAGIFFTHVRTGKLHFDFDWEDYVALDWNASTFEESGAIEAPLPAVLKVENAHGSVEIVGAAEDKISFILKKKIWRRTEEKARQVAANLHPVVTREESQVRLSTNREEFKKKNFKTSFRITCPENMVVEVTNSYGPVKIQAVGRSTILNRHGKIVASDVRSEIWLESSHDAVDLENVQSHCRVKSRHADVSARLIQGEITVETSFGKIDLHDIGQKVTIKAPHTEVSGKDLAGPVEILNSYKRISLTRVGPLQIETRHSPIEVTEVHGDLNIRDSYADVQLKEMHGNIWISGKNLAVIGRTLIGEKIYISSSYKDIELSDFSGKTTILISHGKVSLTPLPLVGPIEVRGDYSPIFLYWPPGEKFPFEARTKSGDIHWRLPGDIQLSQQDRFTTARVFTELGDRPGIFLGTTYCDIEVAPGPPR